MVNRSLAHFLPAASLPALLAILTGCTSPVVSPSALSLAQQRVAREVGELPKKGSLVIVDYTKPSSEKRMTVVDLKTGRAKMNTLVAHGVNSGLLYATNFSDQVGSEKSSLGLYKVAEEFNGKHGPSLRLDGLDPGWNINARRRGIIVHSANYVSKETMRENRNEYGRLGRSQGCLALSDKDMAKLDRKLARPAYVFAYAPTMLAQGTYLPVTPAVEAPSPAPALAKAERKAPARQTETLAPTLVALERKVQTTPAPAPAPKPEIVDLPAIPRPAAVQTGPVALAADGAQASFYTAYGTASQP
jgi:hypothetical protein